MIKFYLVLFILIVLLYYLYYNNSEYFKDNSYYFKNCDICDIQNTNHECNSYFNNNNLDNLDNLDEFDSNLILDSNNQALKIIKAEKDKINLYKCVLKNNIKRRSDCQFINKEGSKRS